MKKKLPPGTLSFGGVTIGEVKEGSVELPGDCCEFDLLDVESASTIICTPTCDEWARIEHALFPHRFN